MWKLGSMFSKWVISPIYKWSILGVISHLPTIDPNKPFPGHPSLGTFWSVFQARLRLLNPVPLKHPDGHWVHASLRSHAACRRRPSVGFLKKLLAGWRLQNVANIFYFHPEPWGIDPISQIFFKWIKTTN